MHSRIYQLSTKELDQDDFLEDYHIHDWFLETVADYVNDSDREKDIEWLEESLSGVTFEDDRLIINDVAMFKKAYFKTRFIQFQEAAKTLTLDDFSSNSMDNYRMTTLVEDKFGYYVYTNGEFMTMDRFVREMQATEDGSAEFYIGGTLDYHY